MNIRANGHAIGSRDSASGSTGGSPRPTCSRGSRVDERPNSRCSPLFHSTMRATLIPAKAWRAARGKERRVARRYQRGCVFKRGKKEKVWIGRWREDIVNPDGSSDRIQHSMMLGLVSVIPSKHEAQMLLED